MGKVLDRDDVVLVDYEFGDSISFKNDRRSVESICGEIIGYHTRHLKALSEFESEETRLIINELVDRLEALREQSRAAVAAGDWGSYRAMGLKWKEFRESLERRYREGLEKGLEAEVRNEENKEYDPGYNTEGDSGLDRARSNVWYLSVDAERAFTDVPDWEEIIEPKLESYALILRKNKLSEEEVKEKVSKRTMELIDDLRLKKQTTKSHVIKGIFPELPIKDGSFDRFVASWSISAHAFAHLDKEGFAVSNREIIRVLKSGGKAYIFPLNYRGGPNFDALEESLFDLAAKNEISWEWRWGETGEVLPDKHKEYAYTLCITKK